MTYPAKVMRELPRNIRQLVKRDLEVPIKKLVSAFALETGFKPTTINRVIESMIENEILWTDGNIVWIENRQGDTNETKS